MSTIDVLLVPAEDAPIEVRTIEPRLHDYYRILDVQTIEAIGDDDWSAYCDEEGKLKGSPFNQRATRLARLLGWTTSDFLVGNVIFLGPVDEEGGDTSMPSHWTVEGIVSALVRGVRP